MIHAVNAEDKKHLFSSETITTRTVITLTPTMLTATNKGANHISISLYQKKFGPVVINGLLNNFHRKWGTFNNKFFVNWYQILCGQDSFLSSSSYLKDSSFRNAFISTQGPLPRTYSDTWQVKLSLLHILNVLWRVHFFFHLRWTNLLYFGVRVVGDSDYHLL